MLASLTGTLLPAFGQEIARPSMARQRAEVEALPRGNLQIGDLRLSLDASAGAEFIDNVFLTPDHQVSDLVLRPTVGVTAVYPLTERNTLRLHTTVSYAKYLENSRLDDFQVGLSPDSALRFFIYTGDFRIELHDQFNLTDETASSGTLSGIAKLPRFTNTAGLGVLWDLDKVQLEVGYDHYNFTTVGSTVTNGNTPVTDLGSLDHRTDQFSAVATLLTGWGRVGLEGTYALSDYPESPSSNFTSFTAGPTLSWQITKYTGVSLSGGYKQYSFQGATLPEVSLDSNGQLQLAEVNTASVTDGFYVNLSVVHRLNPFYTDHLDLGHEDQVDALSGRTQSTFVRYQFALMMNPQTTLSGGAVFEDVQQTAGAVTPTQPDKFQQFHFDLSTGYRLTRHANLSMSYQYANRFGGQSDRQYQQNRVYLGIAYSF